MKYLLTLLILVLGMESTLHAATKKSSKRHSGNRSVASVSNKHKHDKKKKKAHQKKKHHGMNYTTSQSDQFKV